MITKSYANKITNRLLDHIESEFGEDIQIKFPITFGSTQKKSYTISAMVTNVSLEDYQNFSIEEDELRTVDIKYSTLDQLKEENPSALIIKKNFKKNSSIVIDRKEYKVIEEQPNQQYGERVRLICHRSVM